MQEDDFFLVIFKIFNVKKKNKKKNPSWLLTELSVAK